MNPRCTEGGVQVLLNHAAILIAEDENYIALALQWAV